jgi:polar amino acid transport system substrate-binding protein
MTANIVQHLAPTGTMRAGVFLGNFLLITGQTPAGVPEGVSPDLCAALAEQLGVQLELVPFKSQDALVEAVATGECDIGLVGSDPARAEKITFTPAYVEIEATYLVPQGSPIIDISQVDCPGIRIAVPSRSAYELWLVRNLKHATLVSPDGFEATIETFVKDKLDVLAGLRVGLQNDIKRLPGSRILEGKFAAIQQAASTRQSNPLGAQYLSNFIEEAKASGLVAQLIAKHQVVGLMVAPPHLTD